MKFRPCIDIHNGKVKQLVGGTLKDKGNKAQENFVQICIKITILKVDILLF